MSARLASLPGWARACLAALLGLLLTAGIATTSTASAAASETRVVVAVAPQQPAGACDADPTETEGCTAETTKGRFISYYTSQLRPSVRWAEPATMLVGSIHGIGVEQAIDMSNRVFVQATGLKVGGFLNQTTSAMVQTTSSLDFMNSIGGALDLLMSNIARLVTDTAQGFEPLIIVVLLAAIVFGFGYSFVRRGGLPMLLKRLTGTAILAALLVFAVVQQSNAFETADPEPGYQPEIGTPMWAVRIAEDTATGLTDGPARVVSSALLQQDVTVRDDAADENPLSCKWFLAAMHQQYERQMSNINAATYSAAEAIDGYWMATGLRVWTDMQLGANNPWAQSVACHLLNARSNEARVTSASSAFLVSRGVELSGVDGAETIAAEVRDATNRAPFARPSAASGYIRQAIFWAACTPTGASMTTAAGWTIESPWVGFNGEGATQPLTDPAKCAEFWNAADAASAPNEFYFAGSSGKFISALSGIVDTNDRLMVADYLSALSGSRGGMATDVGLGQSIAYVVGAFLQLLAFTVLCVIVFFAKLSLVFFAISLWFVLIAALFKRDVGDLLVKTLKKFFSTLIIASMLSLILSIVALFSRIIDGASASLLGAGSIWAMIFSGLSPALAMWGLHLVFTKILKVPSPFTIRGAMAWSAAGGKGAIAAAAGRAMKGMAAGATMFSPARQISARIKRAAESRDRRRNLQDWGKSRDWKLTRRGTADATGRRQPTTGDTVKKAAAGILPLAVGGAVLLASKNPKAAHAAATGTAAAGRAIAGAKDDVKPVGEAPSGSPASQAAARGRRRGAPGIAGALARPVGDGTERLGTVLPTAISAASDITRMFGRGQNAQTGAVRQVAALSGARHTRGAAALERAHGSTQAAANRIAVGASATARPPVDPQAVAAIRREAVQAAEQVRRAVTATTAAVQAEAVQARRDAAASRAALVEPARRARSTTTPAAPRTG